MWFLLWLLKREFCLLLRHFMPVVSSSPARRNSDELLFYIFICVYQNFVVPLQPQRFEYPPLALTALKSKGI